MSDHGQLVPSDEDLHGRADAPTDVPSAKSSIDTDTIRGFFAGKGDYPLWKAEAALDRLEADLARVEGERDEALADAQREHDCVERWSLRAEAAEAQVRLQAEALSEIAERQVGKLNEDGYDTTLIDSQEWREWAQEVARTALAGSVASSSCQPEGEPELNAYTLDIAYWVTECGKAEARVGQLEEATKRAINRLQGNIGRQEIADDLMIALAGSVAPTHDCADHTVTADEGTSYCARCEAEARRVG